MMTKELLVVMGALFVSSGAFATDDMTFLQSPGKLTVLLSEVGQTGKLAKLFHAFVSDNDLNQFRWSTDGSVTSEVIVTCNREDISNPDTVPYSCTLTFQASPTSTDVVVNSDSMSAKVGDQSSSVLVSETFVNAAGDSFSFQMMSAGLTASATQHQQR